MYQQDYSCKKRPAAAQIINVPDAFLCNPLIIRHLPPPPPQLSDNQLVKAFFTRNLPFFQRVPAFAEMTRTGRTDIPNPARNHVEIVELYRKIPKKVRDCLLKLNKFKNL